MDLVNVLFTVIGFLSGCGAMAIWLQRRVDKLDEKMARSEVRIDSLTEAYRGQTELQTETVRTIGNIADQNNFLIQKILANAV